MFGQIINTVNDALYSYILIIILVLGGLYFTCRTRFVQFRLFKEQFRAVMEKPQDGNGVSSFQALMVSTASRVGTGNIIGVSTALCLGGFGSVFWMWLIAIVGSASAFIESTLAQIYKKKGPDGSYGGPAYYIENALKCRSLAIVFSILIILTYGFGFNMLASYNLQSTFSSYDFYNKENEHIAAKRCEGGFVSFKSVLKPKEKDRNTFTLDMIISGTKRVEENPERNKAIHFRRVLPTCGRWQTDL